MIDHMFVKSDTFNNVINYSTIESSSNLSDHAPISCVIAMVEPSHNSRKTKLSATTIKTLRQSRLRWDKGDVALYYQKTGERLQNLNIPWELLRGQCADSNCNHQTAINEYYNNLINVLNDAAIESIPLLSGNSIKPYWSEHLQQ